MWHMWQERTHGPRVPFEEKLGRHARTDVWVPILNGSPLAPRRRVLSSIQETQAVKQALDWLARGIVEKISNPPLVNNLVLALKGNGQIRVCVDCTPANKVTEDLDWAMPRLQDLRYFVKGTQWFARIDLSDAFFRLLIPVQYRHLTAFRAGGQTYQFKRMPFGLKTAPAHFQRYMDWGLSEYTGWAFWYLDDILIKGTTLSELRQRERAIRARLKQMGSTVNETKSETGKTSLRFAGLWVTGVGIGPDLRKVYELLNIPAPTTKAEAQSALGLVSYLRDFIPLVTHFTAMLHPDKNGLRLGQDDYARQWSLLLRHLANAWTINHHWKEGIPADLYTDASLTGLGVILIQGGKVVALAARKLSSAETRYSATDREHLGLVYAAEKFRIILHQPDSPVRVWTDHNALLSRKREGLLPRQARWTEIITAWIPKLNHVKGMDNPADFISRWRLATVGAELRA